MTEPDEALLWAREQAVAWWERAPGVREKDKAAHIENIRAGKSDDDLEDAVRDRLSWLEGYRAGTAASEARIKELEARVAELEAALRDIAEGDVCVCDLRDARDRTLQSIALAALKEADQ